MELDGINEKFLRFCEVISRMAYINILWIFFTVLGLVVFGFMPATVGLFAIIRKWLMNDRDIPILPTFWKHYRREFIKSNLLGLILLIIGFILFVDIFILPHGGFYNFLRYGLIIIFFLYVIILLYIFPFFVHYKLNISQYIKYSLLLGASHPHLTILMIISIVALYHICIKIPGVIPFFSISILGYILMSTAHYIIKKIEGTETIIEEGNEKNDLIHGTISRK